MKRLELPYSRKAEIKAVAAGVLKKHPGGVPVDLLGIVAGEEELDLRHEDLQGEYEGMIGYSPATEKYHVLLDRDAFEYPARGRFSLAHELGHYFIVEHMLDLSSGRLPHFRFPSPQSGGYSEALAEAEANYFASQLLVPDDDLRPRLALCESGGRKVSAEFISELAERFLVSFQCACIRVLEETTHPCALVVFGPEPPQSAWVEVSDAFGIRLGPTRNSRVKGLIPLGFDHKLDLVENWLNDVKPSARGQLIAATIIRGRQGTVALLSA